MTRLSILILCVMGSVPCLVGCSGTRSPAIVVTGASLGETTQEGVTLQIAVQLENPNTDPLELLEFDYSIEVNGRRMYDGKRAAQMTLSRLSTRTAMLPGVLRFDQMNLPETGSAAGMEVEIRGTLRYLLPGAFAQTLVDIGARRPRTGFHGSQRITLPPTTAPQSAAAFSDAPLTLIP